ncbi:MAG: HlyD family secretion protein [Candidatus Moranbacteria bacterium]|nr:HlyD family secretion protein [Candidatus Moranbacteria bacterium]
MENTNAKNQANGETSRRREWIILAVIAFAAAGLVAIFYLYLAQSRIYVEKSGIEAQPISLSSQQGGILQTMFVKIGDDVSANQPVAQIGNEVVKTKDPGKIISANNDIGKNFAPDEAVATMIRPDDLRLVARVEEDKGLNKIEVGQKVFFTVDAFGSKEYSGIVDEVSPTARSGDIVFNISSARQENEFNVKVRFNVSDYPELKNGMSAKSWIYVK